MSLDWWILVVWAPSFRCWPPMQGASESASLDVYADNGLSYCSDQSSKSINRILCTANHFLHALYSSAAGLRGGSQNTYYNRLWDTCGCAENAISSVDTLYFHPESRHCLHFHHRPHWTIHFRVVTPDPNRKWNKT